MLIEVTKTENVLGETVSILRYEITDKTDDLYHHHYYEVRVSANDKNDSFYTYEECYTKRDAMFLFRGACALVKSQHAMWEARMTTEREAKKEKEDAFDLISNALSCYCEDCISSDRAEQKRIDKAWVIVEKNVR